MRIKLTARNGRDDADFIAVLERGLLVLEKTDVLLVHIDIHEAPDFAALVRQSFLDAGTARLQFRDRRADGGGVDLDNFLVVREFAERRRYSYFLSHNIMRSPAPGFRPPAVFQIRGGWA